MKNIILYWICIVTCVFLLGHQLPKLISSTNDINVIGGLALVGILVLCAILLANYLIRKQTNKQERK